MTRSTTSQTRGHFVSSVWFLSRYLLLIVPFVMASCLSPNASAGQWKTVRSTQQPIAISYHEAQINRNLANRLRANRRIGSRALRQDEIASVVRARTTILNRLLQWSESAYETEVNELGFVKPAGIWLEHNGKQYLHLFLYDFGDEHGGITFGSVSRSNSALRLNIRAFWRKVPNPSGRPKRALRGTVAHELFHAIQNQYAVNFSRWAKESTAEWCVEQVFPDQNHFVPRQNVFLRFPQQSLHQVFRDSPSGQPGDNEHDHHRYAGNIGRPYGASAFWLFLEDHYQANDSIWMKDLWEHARTTNDAYEALARVLGESEPLGPKFREYFTRYAVGSLLHDVAPPNYRLHEVELLVERQGTRRLKVRPPTVNLDNFWERHLRNSLTRPETAVMKIAWNSMASSPDSQAGPDYETSTPIGIAGAAFRVFRVPTQTSGQNGLPILLEVAASEHELSISAVTKNGGEWKVFHSNYDDQHRKHRATIPANVNESRYVYFVVCRFDRELATKPYELCFSTIQPPQVRRITLEQAQQTLFTAEWKPQPNSDARVGEIRLTQSEFTLPSADGQDIDLIVNFTHDVRKGERPTCRLNSNVISLEPAENDRSWRAKIPVSKLLAANQREHTLRLHAELKLSNPDTHIPLDENPETRPTLNADLRSWKDYERSEAGVVVRLKTPRTYVAKMQPNSLVRQQTHGPVWVSLTLADGEFGKSEQPYLVEVTLGEYRQYLYPTNIDGYGLANHPLQSLNSFKLPEMLSSPLPETLKASFVTQNGDRVEKEFALKLESPTASQFGSSPEEISRELARWRDRVKKALESTDTAERRFNVLIREGGRIVTYTDQYSEAERIWAATLDAYTAAKRDANADQAWIERKFGQAEMMMMGTAYRFEQTDRLVDLLAARTSRGQAVVTDYIGVIDACVRFQNDTQKAHQLWEQMQQLPEAQRRPPTRAAMTENWRFSFDTLADYTQELKLPKKPISP